MDSAEYSSGNFLPVLILLIIHQMVQLFMLSIPIHKMEVSVELNY